MAKRRGGFARHADQELSERRQLRYTSLSQTFVDFTDINTKEGITPNSQQTSTLFGPQNIDDRDAV